MYTALEMADRIDLATSLPLICTLARQAGQAVMEIYEGRIPSAVRLKEDRSPVTAADLASERAILAGLGRAFPGVPVISEESSPGGGSPAPSFFLVDPLDGTKEFLARNGEFTVNIALIEAAQPVMGVIYAPALDELYYARAGGGSYHCSPGGPAVRIRCAPAHHPPRAVVSRSHLTEEEERFLREHAVGEVRRMGSSLKGCRVARGDADVYFRAGDVMEWDIAAMQCILVEAGGSLSLRRGTVRRYGSAPYRITGGFIARGR